MDLITKAFSEMFETRSSVSGGRSVMDYVFGGSSSLGSRRVNHKSALKISAVYNAVDIISNAVAIVPFGVYQKTKEGRSRVGNHPVDHLISLEPDGAEGYLTAFVFKKITKVSVLLRGNALWRIDVSNAGELRLKFLSWDDVYDIKEVDGTLLYYVKGLNAPLLQSEVLHIKGLSLNGKVGLSVIAYAAYSLGIAMEMQHFAGTAVQNKGVRTGVIHTDKSLGSSQKQYSDNADVKKAIKNGWKNAMQEAGPDRVVVLDDGLQFQPITITPQEAQIIEMNRFSIEDIARWFNVPLHMLKSLQQSTNNNIEQQSLDFVMITMQPHVTNFEQEFGKKLLHSNEKRQGYFIKGNMNVLLRADVKARGEFYSKMVNGGIYTANEVRELEEMNKLDGGDDLRIPVNTQTQEQIDKSLKNEK